MRILGIDPGTATIGYGLVECGAAGATAIAYGVIRTEKHQPMPERLKELHADMSCLLVSEGIEAVAVEELFFFRNVNTALPVAQARGVILLACAQAGLPVVGYTPMQVKQAIAGSGKADKREVQESIQALLALPAPPRPDDAADALSIAMTHWLFLEGRGER